MTETVSALQQRKRKPATAPTEPSYGTIFEANQRALEQWLHGMTEISQEIAQFAQSRLQQDAEVWMQFAACRGPDDAFACHQRFAENIVRQYIDEATKLSQMVVGMTSRGLSAAPRGSGTAA